ncbi:MAG: selenocysteine-specific translation elongation factor [Chthonomonadales bacterium]|nr:selenocysteine-specific translation elongation factor [Chthonomonadales bacterium]
MKHVVIATAGHVDHGKTTLIQALTGTNTDRLTEEQARGMTIDLGFAALTLPDGSVAGIVDVPGHERFLKNMLAGAGGADVVLLVVAADESVMPQTLEHVRILELLGAREGVVALTKVALVDRDWLQVVEEDVRAQLAATFLRSARIVRVDSLKGTGIAALKRVLFSAVSRAEPRDARVPFRLPIDRVFTRPGFGTVVTGTLIAGTITTEDPIEVLPARLPARVRGLQSHGSRAASVSAGTRVAANLAGVEPDDVARGALLAPPGYIVPTSAFDAEARVLQEAARPLADRERVRLYLGAAEVLGRVRVLGGARIGPGEHGWVQFRAETPMACVRGDRFVMRVYSPMALIGGGVVLDAHPARHRRSDAGVVEALAARARGDAIEVATVWLQGQPFGAELEVAAASAGIAAEDVPRLLEAEGVQALGGNRIIHPAALLLVTERARGALAAYHAANPLRRGMPKEELRSALGRPLEPRAFAPLLRRWQNEGSVVSEGVTVRLAGFTVELNPRQRSLLERVAAALRSAWLAAPSLAELSQGVGAPPDAVAAILRVGAERGVVVRVTEEMAFHADAVEAARQALTSIAAEDGVVAVGRFRDVTGTSRKYAVPLLEYFDSVRFTRRRGDVRLLADGG